MSEATLEMLWDMLTNEQLARTMRTVSERYGVDWLFCRKDQTAGTICELLGVEWWR